MPPRTPRVRRAEGLWLEGHSAEARPLFETARRRRRRGARRYLDKRLAAITIERDLAAGRSARLLPGKLPGWNVKHGKWIVETDGSLLGTSGSRGLMIVSDARVGPYFELAADVEIASTSNGQFQAALLFGNGRRSGRDGGRASAEEDGVRGRGGVLLAAFQRAEASLQRKVAQRSHVVIQSWDGRLWAWVDGGRRSQATGRNGTCHATPTYRSASAGTSTTTRTRSGTEALGCVASRPNRPHPGADGE